MKEKVFANLIWRFLERSGAQIISFIVTIVLARILTPEDYGEVALLTVFSAVLQVMVDGGFGNALIQKKDADDLDFSSVFYFNIVFCGILYLGIFILAPFVAKFYENEHMVSMLRAIGLMVVISGVKNVQQAYVSRTMQFRKFFFSTIIGTVLSAFIGIFMAYHGYGAWSLIMQMLSNAMIDTIIVWITVPWRPRFVFSIERLKNLFSFGWKLLASNIIDTVYGNFRQLVIGKLYSSSELAYYNRGRYIPNLIVVNVNTSIDSVLFPVMSINQNDSKGIKRIAKRSISISNYIMAPLMMGITSMAAPLVQIVLTSKWLPSIPYIRIFCVLYMFQPIHTTNTNVIKALGHSGTRLKQEIITKGIGIILLLMSMKYGVLAIAYAYLAGNFINQYINSYPCKNLIGYSYWEQLKDIFPSTLLAIVMGGIVYLVSFLKLQIYIQIILQIIVGMTVYIAGSIIFHLDSFYYLLNMVGVRRNSNGIKK